MKKFLPIFAILIFTTIFYLPILIHPSILTSRGNDLTEFFWPIFYFVRENLFNNHQLPFWNNLFFSGTPLLPDPQSPIFYLPNIIFLFFKNIDLGFVISIFIHIFLAGVGMYYLSNKGFKFSTKVSLFCSFLYISSPKLSGFIEAGHFGLITSWSWIPFAFLSTILLAKKPNIKKTIILSIFLSLIFYTHILIFGITTISISLLFIYITFSQKNTYSKNLFYFLFVGIFTFGLVAISFIPQILWQGQTTRNLLLNDPDIYPKWLGLKDFLKASLSPIINGPNFIWNLDTEKIIGVGFFTSILAAIGFIKIKKNQKILITSVLSIIALISLNNISPINNLLIKQNWYVLLRVSTRFWFIIVIISILLAGKGLENLTRNGKYKFIIYIIAFLSISELLLTSWTRITKPITPNANLAPKEVYEFLKNDKSKFRVFCLTRCLSQRDSVIYGLELADGYGTLQQLNYYHYSEQLSQSFYRNRYTLSIPPFEIFEYENLQPYSPNLASYNIKYVISNHSLKDKNLKLVKQIDKFQIYENMINLPRSNYPINVYTPNFIQVDTSIQKSKNITLSEVYNKDWSAYLNGEQETTIIETQDKTREVTIKNDTKFVNFAYTPKNFIIGSIITLITIVTIIIVIL